MKVFISTNFKNKSESDIRKDIRTAKAVLRALVELPNTKAVLKALVELPNDGDSTKLIKTKLAARKLLLGDLLPTDVFCEPLSFAHNLDSIIPENETTSVKHDSLYHLGNAFKTLSTCDAIAIFEHDGVPNGHGVIMEDIAANYYNIGPRIEIWDDGYEFKILINGVCESSETTSSDIITPTVQHSVQHSFTIAYDDI